MAADQTLHVLQLIYKPDHLLPLFNLYSRALMNQGHRVTTVFLTGAISDALIDETVADAVEFCEFSTRQIKSSKLKVSQAIRRLWLAGRYNLALCHRHKPSFIFSMARLELKQAPMLSVVHALGQYKRKSRRFHASLFYSSQVNQTALVGVSQAVSNDIKYHFNNSPPCPVITIPNCINIDSVTKNQFSREKSREVLGLDWDDFIIGNVARLVADKAQHDLITAFSDLLKTHPLDQTRLKLLIIGSGNCEQALKNQVATLGIESNVKFAGEFKLASRLMPAFDLFVLSSSVEPFGLVLLEAMAAKLPVVSTNVDSIPVIVNKDAILVPPHSPQELTDAMTTMFSMNHQQRSAIGINGYRHLSEYFSETQFQNQLLSAVSQLTEI
ncbi:MAG: glycosyltransferase [Gammaproteobacteria bacterium]|nr:glycosyltransferase [Gammaproteobacteria bacterium]